MFYCESVDDKMAIGSSLKSIKGFGSGKNYDVRFRILQRQIQR